MRTLFFIEQFECCREPLFRFAEQARDKFVLLDERVRVEQVGNDTLFQQGEMESPHLFLLVELLLRLRIARGIDSDGAHDDVDKLVDGLLVALLLVSHGTGLLVGLVELSLEMKDDLALLVGLEFDGLMDELSQLGDIGEQLFMIQSLDLEDLLVRRGDDRAREEGVVKLAQEMPLVPAGFVAEGCLAHACIVLWTSLCYHMQKP